MFEELVYLVNPRRGYSSSDILIIHDLLQDLDLAIREYSTQKAIALGCGLVLSFRLQIRDVAKFNIILEEHCEELLQEITHALASEG